MIKRYCSNPPSKLFQFKSTATAVFELPKLWTNIYPYDSSYHPIVLDVQFLDNRTTSKWQQWEKAWVAYIITTTIMLSANIVFIFHINDNTLPSFKKTFDIRISRFLDQGCYSYIGTDSLEVYTIDIGQSMNLGWMDAPFSHDFIYNNQWYRTGRPMTFDNGGYTDGAGSTIIHEFGHALGMHHELQSPFSNPLVFNIDKTYAYFKGEPNNWSEETIDYNVLVFETASHKNGSTFDQYSIMKYSLPACLLLNGATNPAYCNNFPNSSIFYLSDYKGETTPVGNYIQQYNNSLSNMDKLWLSINYPYQLNPNPPKNNTSTIIIITVILIVSVIVISLVIYYRRKH